MPNYLTSEKRYSNAERVARLLSRKNKTVSVAESCTGGLITNMLTNIPGSSKYLLSGIVAYSNKQKVKILGVKKNTMDRFGAVSENIVREMLDGVRKLSGSDYAVAVSGVAGPGGGTKNKPVGLVYIGTANSSGCEVNKYRFSGGRLKIKRAAADKALELLKKIV